MAFPDDYRRVQQAGGTQAQVESTAGLPRQILIDMENLSPRLMDGVNDGGHKFLMHHEFDSKLQTGPEGEVDYIKDQVTNDPTNIKRFWRSSKLRLLFQMIADMTDVNNWVVKNEAMPAGFRASAILVSDMNTALVDGFYRFVPDGALNIPAGLAGTDQYMMMVIRQSSSELTQIVYSRATDGKIWIRSRVGGVFQAWTLATGVTAADLLLKVDKAGDTMTGKLTLPVPTNVLSQLNLRTGVSPSAPSDGDLWRDDGNGGLRLRKGGITQNLVDTSAKIRSPVAIIADQKPQGTGPGIGAGATWNIRDLNTELYDPDSIVTIASNQFTLAAGSDYKVSVATNVQVNGSSNSQSHTRIFNVTDGVPITHAVNANVLHSASAQTGFVATFEAVLSGGKTYRIETWLNVGVGYSGTANKAGMPENFTVVNIERMVNVITP